MSLFVDLERMGIEPAPLWRQFLAPPRRPSNEVKKVNAKQAHSVGDDTLQLVMIAVLIYLDRRHFTATTHHLTLYKIFFYSHSHYEDKGIVTKLT